VVVVIIILLLVGFVYITSVGVFGERPYQVLTPEVYEKGTTVSLYKGTPPKFPEEVILEDKPLDYSGSVVSPQGKTQITVSYISNKTMNELVELYSQTLPSVGWGISEKSIYEKVSIIKTDKGDQSVLLSISPLEKGGVLVTFQYEK